MNPELSRNLCGLLNNYDKQFIGKLCLPTITTEKRAVALIRYAIRKLDISDHGDGNSGR
jgi:hypothetical protein